jgi:periplasmic protein TonB
VSAAASSGRLLGWPVGMSIGVHVVAIATASAVAALAPAPPPAPASVPIEVVRLDPLPAPPPERPKPARRELKRQEKIVAPRLVTQPAGLVRPMPLPAPLLDDAPRREPTPAAHAEPTDTHRILAGAAASSSFTIPGAPGPRTSKTGALFSTGDLPMPRRGGGSGGSGGTGQGSGGLGKGDATGDATGLTSFARPLGGYQTRPRYPDSARREGIEGEALLRFQVLTTGRVDAVSVARSAGHPDLDRAAIEAVKTWLFEPARRGKDAVSVWVTLPVRFQLDTRASE